MLILNTIYCIANLNLLHDAKKKRMLLTPFFYTVKVPLREGVLVGLGGGCFAMYLSAMLPWLRMDVVELDPSVVQLARDYFGFTGVLVKSSDNNGKLLRLRYAFV